MDVQILKAAEEILHRLQQNGFCSVLVGGCVRDLLLGRPVHDWDIATSARPEQIARIFEKTVLTGARFGTVTVLHGGEPFEVTSFRTDGAYLDGRRPAQVVYVDSLQQDLARRDFTINAMALDLNGTITDPFGGRQDLEARCIRCVGAAKTRFQEDGLRMLRALRFSAQLGFSIAPQTEAAIAACAPLAQRLSAERVRDEVEKTICSPRPQVIGRFFDYGFLQRFGAERLGSLPWTRPDRMSRWAALLSAAPGLSLQQLRLEKRLIHICTEAVNACRVPPPDLLKLYAEQGEACAQIAAQIGGVEAAYHQLAQEGRLVSLSDLAVSGRDLTWLHGAQVGRTLQALLAHVQQQPQDNKRQILLDLARSL